MTGAHHQQLRLVDEFETVIAKLVDRQQAHARVTRLELRKAAANLVPLVPEDVRG